MTVHHVHTSTGKGQHECPENHCNDYVVLSLTKQSVSKSLLRDTRLTNRLIREPNTRPSYLVLSSSLICLYNRGIHAIFALGWIRVENERMSLFFSSLQMAAILSYIGSSRRSPKVRQQPLSPPITSKTVRSLWGRNHMRPPITTKSVRSL